MSYYILPKKNNILNVNPIFSSTFYNDKEETNMQCNKYINQSGCILNDKLSNTTLSNSLYFYLKKQIEQTVYNEEVFNSINPYEFIFSKVPGYNFSVSKIRPPSRNFYILMELSNIFNLFESFSKKDITTMHFSSCPEATMEYLDMHREDKQDIHIPMDLETNLFKFMTNPQINNYHMIEFMYFDIDPFDELCTNEIMQIKLQEYFNKLIAILLNIIIYQNRNGITVIKIGNIMNKFILDFIFILSGLFEKVYIIKPNTSNIFKSDRFIVCKFFDYKNYNIDETLKLCISEKVIKNEEKNKFLISLIDTPLPYYFLNKIEECNIIIGEQQLEAYDQVNNIIKNKNKDDKLETIRKNNIQKCIQMCEKFKIPYNKFSDKINIFLQGHVSDENNSHNLFINSSIDSSIDSNIEIIGCEDLLFHKDFEEDLELEEKLIDKNTTNSEFIQNIINNLIQNLIDNNSL
jgi:hypothetical protein